MFIVSIRFEVELMNRREIKEAVRKFVQGNRTAEGNVESLCTEDLDGSGIFHLYEVWTDGRARARHAQTVAAAAFKQALSDAVILSMKTKKYQVVAA